MSSQREEEKESLGTISSDLAVQQKKLAIIQVPESISPESLELIKENLDFMVERLSLDGSEIRLLRPDKGGRPKKFATKEEEQAHYRQYFRDYYHQKLSNKEGQCPHCQKKFKTYTSVARHIRKSVRCQQLRFVQEGLAEGGLADADAHDPTVEGEREAKELEQKTLEEGANYVAGC